jgi:hypothetical protein
MIKKRRSRSQIEIKPIDVMATMRDEIAEAVELMRPHFPADDEDALRNRAEALRAQHYQTGRWPDFKKVAAAEAAGSEK